MKYLARHNVRRMGAVGHRPLVFAHGHGCDQQVGRHVAPAFEPRHEVLLFDHVGAGGSDLDADERQRHATLEGHVRDDGFLRRLAGRAAA